MMAYLLLFGIIILIFLAYILSKGDILDPWFISCGMFAISVLVALISANNWGVEINVKTALFILLALLFFGLGEITTKLLFDKKTLKKRNEYSLKKINISFNITLCVFLIDMIIAYFTYKRMLALAFSAGYPGGPNTLWYVHYALNKMNLSWGSSMALLQHFVFGSCYVFTFIFINNIFFSEERKKKISYWYYLLPTIPHMLIQIMNAGRSGIIEYIVMIIFMVILAWKIKHPTLHYPVTKFIVFGSIAIIAFFIAFRAIGNLSGKSTVLSAWDNFSLYLGSPIAALNQFLDGEAIRSKGFGLYSFKNVRSLLSRVGFDVNTVGTHDSFVYFKNGLNTNIYTALKNYYVDFGFIGMLIIQMFMGIFYSLFYKIIKLRKKFDLWIIIYSYFAYSLIYQIFTSSFTTKILSVSQILSILFIFVWYYLLCKNNKKIVLK